MSDGQIDQMMLIGLHKLAAHCGDGLVPELYELLMRRSTLLTDNPAVIDLESHKRSQLGRCTPDIEGDRKSVILSFPAIRSPGRG